MNEQANQRTYTVVDTKMPNPDPPSLNDPAGVSQHASAQPVQGLPERQELSCSGSPLFLEQPSPANSSMREYEGLAISAQLGTPPTVHSSCRTPCPPSSTGTTSGTLCNKQPAGKTPSQRLLPRPRNLQHKLPR